MHLNYNTTIHLTVADVERIIKDYLKSEGFDATSITFDITKEICGIGPGEHECVNFKGITVRS